jgi:hypothetical protein
VIGNKATFATVAAALFYRDIALLTCPLADIGAEENEYQKYKSFGTK